MLLVKMPKPYFNPKVMKQISTLLILVLVFCCLNCGRHQGEQANGNVPGTQAAQVISDISALKLPPTLTSQELENPDLNQDLSKRSLQELRLLKAAVYASKGYVFDEADLRSYFLSNNKNYQALMFKHWKESGFDMKKQENLALNANERDFVRRVDSLVTVRQSQSEIIVAGQRVSAIGNVINAYQFTHLDSSFTQQLARCNFVIYSKGYDQLYHIYEYNDYHEIPSFVTTDLYLQLFHIYFERVLVCLEKDRFYPMAQDLSLELYQSALKQASQQRDAELKNNLEFSATLFAIASTLLTNKKLDVPSSFKSAYNDELQLIARQEQNDSRLLQVHYFQYDLFKPRGHYNSNDTLKRYFTAMMWLQKAYMCREDDKALSRASCIASMLAHSKTGTGRPLLELYTSLMDPISFLVGEPDNLSIKDLIAIQQRHGANDVQSATKASFVSMLQKELEQMAKAKNRISPQKEVTCHDKINFIPQRYVPDNEIINTTHDPADNSKRPFPKSLDVFAAFGNSTADSLLTNCYEEEKNWSDFRPRLNKQKAKFSQFSDWNLNVYNKWMQGLMRLNQRDSSYPAFMQTEQWRRKNLHTGLASWAELKHDAILYAERPEAAECGGGDDGDPPPPDPVTPGYVEPNLRFWQSAVELLNLTTSLLSKNHVLTEEVQNFSTQLMEQTEFCLSISKKEIEHKQLSEQEFQTIEKIGASYENLTRQLLNKELFGEISGTERQIAVVADVFGRNGTSLYQATGKAQPIYVVVNINGRLYLSCGAVFSYYEFNESGTLLTDEEWQKRLDEGKNIPGIPKWMKDLIHKSDLSPTTDEKSFYSSGC